MALKFECCLIFSLCTVICCAQNKTKELHEYFTALSVNQEFNGSVIVAEKGKILYQKSFGYADFSRKTKNSNKTLINIASVSKTFTAIAVLQLRDQKKLDLDESFAKYFPAFPYPEITIKQLLSHTSGLPDNEALFDSLVAKNPAKVFTNADIIPALTIFKASKKLRFMPGERWGYSNIGYDLLAMLVEKISDQPFAIYMQRNIFRPAGMTHTYIQTSLAQKADKNRCNNYAYNNHYEMKLQQMDSLPDWREFTYNLTGLFGSTNVITNIDDLWAYDKALHHGNLLSAATLLEAYIPVKLNSGENNKAAQGSYGLGWFITIDSAGNKTVSHGGSAPGVLTFFMRNISQNQTLITLQNIQNPTFNISPVLDILNGKTVLFKKSVGFAYGRDLYMNGSDYALAHLLENRKDTVHYIFTERDMARIGLEFSRTKNYQQYSMETYKLNTEFFPRSWKAFDDYANALFKNGQQEQATVMYRKSLELNTDNKNARTMLEKLLNNMPDN